MFLDTNQFNLSSKDYIPALSKPGALELFDETDPNDEKSPFRSSNVNLNKDFSSIRVLHKNTSDVSQMTMSRADLNLSVTGNNYNKDTKACIPKYNIKTTYTQNLCPFFSPKKGREPIEEFKTQDIDSVKLDKKDDKKASSKGFNKSKKSSQQDDKSAKPTPMSMHTSGSPLGLVNNQNMESQVTISGIHIDPEELKRRME